jgi:hypothetical protein
LPIAVLAAADVGAELVQRLQREYVAARETPGLIDAARLVDAALDSRA